MEKRARSPIIEAANLDRMLDGLVAGEYHLLLGAGASAGVRNRNGELPLARELTQILSSEIDGAAAPDNITLQRAFSRASSSRGGDQINALLRHRFAGCTPLPWQVQCASIPWQAIWTLNVDDAMENAYVQNVERVQQAQTVVWPEATIPLGGSREVVPLVHLHGYVGEVERRDDPAVIFTLQQYLGALRSADIGNWQTRFRGDYGTMPVVIIGAQLFDEIDLLTVLEGRNRSAEYGLPSFIVRPGMTEFDKAEYQDWGLVPIDSTAEDFIGLLHTAMRDRIDVTTGGLFESRFTRATFVELTGKKADWSRPRGHDFYGGHQPQWLDILDDLDAPPRWVTSTAEEIGSAQEFPTDQLMYYITGSTFSGKTTALFRLGRELMRFGWRPTLLGGQDKVDADETLQYLADRPNAVLLVDNLRAETTEIATLLKKAEERSQRLLIIATDRWSARRHTARVVPGKFIVGLETTVFVEPTSGLWVSVLIRRRKRGRLGILEGKDRSQWKLHFTEHEQSLYSALASLEDARGFIDRGLRVLETIDASVRDAFVAIGIFAAVGLEAPISAAAAASGLTVDSLVNEASPGGALSEWVTYDLAAPGFVRLRHGYLGELILRHTDPQTLDAQRILRDMLIVISDHVGYGGAIRKDYWHRAVSELMDLRFVQRVVGSSDVDEWYEQLVEFYKKNARFWEQRALGLPEDLDKATSYARRAVGEHEDAFTFNTLATVLMRRAAHPSTPASKRAGYWVEAEKSLQSSRQDGRGRFDFPFRTYFQHTIRVLQLVADVDERWNGSMRDTSIGWIRSADQAGLLSDNEMLDLVAQLPPAWIAASQVDLEARRRSVARRRRRRSGRGGQAKPQRAARSSGN